MRLKHKSILKESIEEVGTFSNLSRLGEFEDKYRGVQSVSYASAINDTIKNHKKAEEAMKESDSFKAAEEMIKEQDDIVDEREKAKGDNVQKNMYTLKESKFIARNKNRAIKESKEMNEEIVNYNENFDSAIRKVFDYRISDNLFDLTKEFLNRLDKDVFTADDEYDFESAVNEELDSFLFYTDDQWEVMKYYQSPEKANYNVAWEEYLEDLIKIVAIIRDYVAKNRNEAYERDSLKESSYVSKKAAKDPYDTLLRALKKANYKELATVDTETGHTKGHIYPMTRDDVEKAKFDGVAVKMYKKQNLEPAKKVAQDLNMYFVEADPDAKDKRYKLYIDFESAEDMNEACKSKARRKVMKK